MNLQLLLLTFVAIVAVLNGSKIVRESNIDDKIYYFLVTIGYVGLFVVVLRFDF
jgi:hypothetical protein